MSGTIHSTNGPLLDQAKWSPSPHRPYKCGSTSGQTWEWVAQVHDFWFGHRHLAEKAVEEKYSSVAQPIPKEKTMKWYRKDPDFDALIVGTFHTRISEFVAMDTESLCTDIALVNPQAWAAVLVVLDQFTRNAYRNTPGAFSGDSQAVQVLTRGVKLNYHKRIQNPAVVGLILHPFEHAEDNALQQRMIELLEEVFKNTDESDPAVGQIKSVINYAHLHADVIKKFGRFPSRNAILGRTTTPEEQAHLDVHGGF
eukprot:TRINITY_DN4815_c0_g1_i1.p1 TRINITY_DN4815_c0_g1~~TRINITY_DN4815_c0_g1_i1.p1  ORF type:complete len:254 (-),score=42.98 TRINITY_DN4815_c0_g1_i1:66-827(-)